jgi:hypothetical protein
MNWLRSIVLVLCSAGVVRAADWPHRFGPYRKSTTTEIVEPWSGPLQRQWHIPLGEGYSSPTVAEGRRFVHAKVPDKNGEEVMAFDAVTAW